MNKQTEELRERIAKIYIDAVIEDVPPLKLADKLLQACAGMRMIFQTPDVNIPIDMTEPQ